MCQYKRIRALLNYPDGKTDTEKVIKGEQMKVLCIIQARMSSSRLPKKVMMPILGKTMLYRQIERVLESKLIDQIIVATSNDKSDDPIEVLCKELKSNKKNIDIYRGELEDVLARFSGIVKQMTCDHIVRLTGDCPLSDPVIIDAIVKQHLVEGADYTSNVVIPTLPDGYDVEVMSEKALMYAAENAIFPSEREHVTPYIRYRQDLFIPSDYLYSKDWSGYRLTVDHPEDLALIRRIFSSLYPNDRCFGVEAVMDLLLSQTKWIDLNASIDRNEGYEKSLLSDREFLRTLKNNAAQIGFNS